MNQSYLRTVLRQPNPGAVMNYMERWEERRRAKAALAFANRKRRILNDLRDNHIRISKAITMLRKLGLSAKDANGAVLEAIRFTPGSHSSLSAEETE